MNFGVDLLKVWDRVQLGRLETIKEFSGRQPMCGAGRPCPTLESVSYYPNVELGKTVPIVVSALNHGTGAATGGITVSFPGVARNGDGCYFETDQPARARLVAHEAGGELLSSDRGTREVFTAKYVLREVQVSPWGQGDSLALRVKITPMREGAFAFYVTAWSATRDWQIIRTPTASEVRDQQNHSVFLFAIRVFAKK